MVYITIYFLLLTAENKSDDQQEDVERHRDHRKAMSLSGMCVALSSAFVYDKKTVVLSVLGTGYPKLYTP